MPATGELSFLFYLLRVVATLAVMAAGAFFFVRHARNKGWVKQNAHVEVIASLPIGKDVFFVLRCGPDVFALTSGHSGTRLIGRWRHEEWLEWEEKERERKESGAVNR
ncbi:MAG: hypothetical protein FWG71_00205 [Synergistaceae bacterium]|nr:hypothetical protein [Synergistaceae bacterium]